MNKLRKRVVSSLLFLLLCFSNVAVATNTTDETMIKYIELKSDTKIYATEVNAIYGISPLDEKVKGGYIIKSEKEETIEIQIGQTKTVWLKNNIATKRYWISVTKALKNLDDNINLFFSDYITEQNMIKEEEERVRQEKLRFNYPAIGEYTSMYGWRDNPTGWGVDFHYGVDIAGYGQIKSVLDGVVTASEWRGGYGNFIEIDHGIVNGIPLKTRYGHLAYNNVYVGEKVSKGQELGEMGTTGRSTGVHLHFEVLEYDEHVDPMNYLWNALDY